MKKLLNKIVDNKLTKLGFVKTRETVYGVDYERVNDKYNYTQVLAIVHKQSGKHLIQSYQKDVNKDKLNNMVGLTGYETLLILLKMKLIGMYSKLGGN